MTAARGQRNTAAAAALNKTMRWLSSTVMTPIPSTPVSVLTGRIGGLVWQAFPGRHLEA